MRVYHFLSTKYALSDLKNRRLKIATFDDLNDPFELWLAKQENRETRKSYRKWKDEMSLTYGLLCFSKSWRNPLLWSNYADRHKGICLGFEASDEIGKNVEYIEKRKPLNFPPDSDLVTRTLFTKYKGWSYEQEWRVYVRLEKRNLKSPHHYFRGFDKDLRLKEVILGPLCDISKPVLHKVVCRYSPHPEIVKARLAFKSFRIVKDQRGFSL